MNLFHWWSEAYEAYGSGHIIVMAETVEQAKLMAYAKFLERLEDDHCIYLDMYKDDESCMQELEQERFDTKSKEFLADLEKEPTTENVLLITGSS